MIAIIVPVIVLTATVMMVVMVVIVPMIGPVGNGARKQGQRRCCRCPKSKYEEFSPIHICSPAKKDVTVLSRCFKVKEI
jgi:hypothetical protein